jgi:hypothetical protein
MFKLNTKDIENYSHFMEAKGLNGIPKYNSEKIKKFLSQQNNDYLHGLEIELSSPFAKIFNYKVYLSLKSLQSERQIQKKNISNYFSDMCLTK